jgi:hypothetical protein
MHRIAAKKSSRKLSFRHKGSLKTHKAPVRWHQDSLDRTPANVHLIPLGSFLLPRTASPQLAHNAFRQRPSLSHSTIRYATGAMLRRLVNGRTQVILEPNG